MKRPEVVYDLPAGGRRLIQRASGYRHTFNAGVETVQNDELTGERPGRRVACAALQLHRHPERSSMLLIWSLALRPRQCDRT